MWVALRLIAVLSLAFGGSMNSYSQTTIGVEFRTVCFEGSSCRTDIVPVPARFVPASHTYELLTDGYKAEVDNAFTKMSHAINAELAKLAQTEWLQRYEARIAKLEKAVSDLQAAKTTSPDKPTTSATPKK